VNKVFVTLNAMYPHPPPTHTHTHFRFIALLHAEVKLCCQ